MGTPEPQHRFAALYDWCGVEIFYYVRTRYSPSRTKILDVGAGWGKYALLFPDFQKDAIEVWERYASTLNKLYDNVRIENIVDSNINQNQYDIIILGDVLEHIETPKAQELIKDLVSKAEQVIVAVPFLYKQGEVEGNPYEEHKQPDLTPSVMERRYPELKLLNINGDKGIYVKR